MPWVADRSTTSGQDWATRGGFADSGGRALLQVLAAGSSPAATKCSLSPG